MNKSCKYDAKDFCHLWDLCKFRLGGNCLCEEERRETIREMQKEKDVNERRICAKTIEMYDGIMNRVEKYYRKKEKRQ